MGPGMHQVDNSILRWGYRSLLPVNHGLEEWGFARAGDFLVAMFCLRLGDQLGKKLLHKVTVYRTAAAAKLNRKARPARLGVVEVELSQKADLRSLELDWEDWRPQGTA